MRILLTRPDRQSDPLAGQLRALGHEPIAFPVIEVCPLADLSALDEALCASGRYAWVIFTSANAVEVFFDRLAAKFPLSSFPSADAPELRVAAIGPATASALRRRGVEPAFVPRAALAEAILPGLGSVAGLRVLLPQAEIARPSLAEAIARVGGIVDAVPIYQTLPTAPDPRALAVLAEGVDAVTFTSPSTVENFTIVARRAGFDPAHLPGDPFFACIGPITRQAAEGTGLPNLRMADEHTAEGLIRLISGLGTATYTRR
ncbi:MAG: uroporphyrinogen-III synthase [Chloroflexota bacterium]